MATDGRGKGVWIWQIPRCERGDIAAIAAKAKAHGLDRVLIKVLDGRIFNRANQGLFEPLIGALRSLGIEPWVWQYIYGNDPIGEAAKAAEIVNDLRVPAFVIDAEAEYENNRQAAIKYMATLKEKLNPEVVVGLSSFYRPVFHPLAWDVFLRDCDFAMPQVYWFRHNPVWALRRSFLEFRKWGKPIIPTLPAYTLLYHSPSEIRTAVAYCNQMQMRGFDFWSWQHAGEARWQVIGEAKVERDLKLINLDAPEGKQVIDCNLQIENGVARVNLRDYNDAIGIETIAQHLGEQGKIYIRRK